MYDPAYLEDDRITQRYTSDRPQDQKLARCGIDLDRISTTALINGVPCNEKVAIDVPSDRDYNLNRWLQDSKEEGPFSTLDSVYHHRGSAEILADETLRAMEELLQRQPGVVEESAAAH